MLRFFSDPPGEPVISIKESDSQSVVFACESAGGFPRPDFSWSLNGQEHGRGTVEEGEGQVTRSEVSVPLSNVTNELNASCNVIHPLVNKTAQYHACKSAFIC